MTRRRILVSAPMALALVGLASGAHAALESFAGIYTGTWNNTTFSSSGPASLVPAIDGAEYQVTIDMDGFAFGQPDPPVVEAAGLVSGGDAVFTMVSAGGYGTLDGTIDGDTGDVSFSITGLLTAGIDEVTVTGSFEDDGSELSLDYSVDFTGPGTPAVGRLDVVRVPETDAARAGVAVLAALAMVGRRARREPARV
jgi:hypothetical protein